MSVLQFISSIKWPITVLLLTGWISWRVKRNPGYSEHFKNLIERRNFRVNIAGQELEVSGVEAAVEAAAITATASDETLADAAQRDGAKPIDVSEIRRDAVEGLIQTAAMGGWLVGSSGDPHPPKLALHWKEDGSPYLVTQFDKKSRSRLDHQASLVRAELERLNRRNTVQHRAEEPPPSSAAE
ncbi:hypothetical protein [Streptomyces sp900116325]|uniref:hypothetical protein n=1 Tax=Streptomyces sp. 900116325 TaxID=3154295 RepID=UPI0033BCA3A6